MNEGAISFIAFTVACAVVFELVLFVLKYIGCFLKCSISKMCRGFGHRRAVDVMRDCSVPIEVERDGELVAVLRIFTVFLSSTLGCYLFLDGDARVTHVCLALSLVLVLPWVTKTRLFCRIANLCFFILRITFVAIAFIPYSTANFVTKNTISLFRQIYKHFFVKKCQIPQK